MGKILENEVDKQSGNLSSWKMDNLDTSHMHI